MILHVNDCHTVCADASERTQAPKVTIDEARDFMVNKLMGGENTEADVFAMLLKPGLENGGEEKAGKEGKLKMIGIVLSTKEVSCVY
jgi:hypothetical protein